MLWLVLFFSDLTLFSSISICFASSARSFISFISLRISLYFRATVLYCSSVIFPSLCHCFTLATGIFLSSSDNSARRASSVFDWFSMWIESFLISISGFTVFRVSSAYSTFNVELFNVEFCLSLSCSCVSAEKTGENIFILFLYSYERIKNAFIHIKL